MIAFEDNYTERDLPVRQDKPTAIIVHTTGSTDLQGILAFYRSADGYQPHYMIALDGTCYRCVDEAHIAYHAKIDAAEAQHYQMGFANWSHWIWAQERPVHCGGEYSGYREWRDTWLPTGAQSPLDLVTGRFPNFRSVGIELQQPAKPGPDIFTDAQYGALSELVTDIGLRHGIPIVRSNLLGHYDVSPMRRCNAAGSWDPGANFRWNRLFDAMMG